MHKPKYPGKGGWQEIIQLAREAANKTSLMGSCENLSEMMLSAPLRRAVCKGRPELGGRERTQVASSEHRWCDARGARPPPRWGQRWLLGFDFQL